MTAKLKLNKVARDWLKKEDACEEGYKWASKNCATLAEVVETARLEWAIWTMTRPGVLTDRELWLFACWSAEQALPAWYAFAPNDHRPRQAIEARRGWLEGTVSVEQLAAAESAAESAARSAARSAAWSAESAARSAAWSAAWSAAESEQVAWIVSNAHPIFADGSFVKVSA